MCYHKKNYESTKGKLAAIYASLKHIAKICDCNIVGMNFLSLSCGKYLFAFRWDSVGIPHSSTTPGMYSCTFRGPILHAKGTPTPWTHKIRPQKPQNHLLIYFFSVYRDAFQVGFLECASLKTGKPRVTPFVDMHPKCCPVGLNPMHSQEQ